MTAPIQQGFPDWGRQFSEAQILEINDNTVTHTGTFNYANRYVGNARGLFCWAQTETVPMRILLNFWAEQAAVNLMDRYEIDLQVNNMARQPIPVLGPYLSASVSPFGGGANTYVFQVWRTPMRGSFAGQHITVGEPQAFGLGIGGGGGQQVITGANVQEGHVYWSGSMAASSWEARFEVINFAGTVRVLDRINGARDRELRSVWVPPMTYQIRFINNDAGATALDCFTSRSFNGF